MHFTLFVLKSYTSNRHIYEAYQCFQKVRISRQQGDECSTIGDLLWASQIFDWYLVTGHGSMREIISFASLLSPHLIATFTIIVMEQMNTIWKIYRCWLTVLPVLTTYSRSHVIINDTLSGISD